MKYSGFCHLRNQYHRLVTRHFLHGLTDSEQKKMDRKGEKLDAYLRRSPSQQTAKKQCCECDGSGETFDHSCGVGWTMCHGCKGTGFRENSENGTDGGEKE